jgi:hypothetical protein
MDNYILHSAVVPGDGAPENIRDKRYWNRLDEYYDKIVAHIRDAAEIQIFGPAEAKHELKKHLELEGLAGNIVSLEDTDNLTDLQIATKVQKRFPARSRFDLSPEGRLPAHEFEFTNEQPDMKPVEGDAGASRR